MATRENQPRQPRSAVRAVANERGAVLPIMAVALAALMGVGALVLDFGLAYVAKSEAQRVADAAALAGATALVTTPWDFERARRVAIATAAENTIRGRRAELLPEDVTVTPAMVEANATRLISRGSALQTVLGRFLGVTALEVRARSRAEVWPAGSATCLKPFIVPDLWFDANGNGVYDTGELYDPQTTGYGTEFRTDGYTRDLGRPIRLTPGTAAAALVPSWYFLIRLPGSSGGSDVRATIASTACDPVVLSTGRDYDVDRESGAKKGPVRQGVDDLIAQDPNAYWDATTRTVRGSKFGDEAWRASPRVINITLFDPTQPVDPGNRPIRVTNFATVFLERTSGDDIIGRFLPTVGVAAQASLVVGGTCVELNRCAPFAKRVRLSQ